MWSRQQQPAAPNGINTPSTQLILMCSCKEFRCILVTIGWFGLLYTYFLYTTKCTYILYEGEEKKHASGIPSTMMWIFSLCKPYIRNVRWFIILCVLPWLLRSALSRMDSIGPISSDIFHTVLRPRCRCWPFGHYFLCIQNGIFVGLNVFYAFSFFHRLLYC